MAKNNKDETMEQREQMGTRSRSAESRQRKTEGQLTDIPETMEDYMLRQLKKTVILKDGNTLKDPHDGHELTAEVRAPFTQGGGLRRGCAIAA